MKNWGNWSYKELKEVVDTAKKEGKSWVTISQEHTDWQNDQQVEAWLKEMGLAFTTEMERTIVRLANEEPA